MKYKWGQLISLEYGKPVQDKAKVDGKYPVYGTNGKIGTSDLPPLCNHPSFILGRKGAYRGVHYSATPFSVIDTAFYAENLCPEQLNIKWAFYKFLTYDINSMDSGSAIPSTDRYEIYAIEVDLPEIKVQEKVVEILSSLDDKIELNRKINENLEQQARTVLSQWMIENEGSYECTLLSDVAVINPDTYSPKDAWEFVNYLDTSSITDGIITEIQHIKPSTEKLPSRARRIIAANDVVFSTVRPNQRHFGIISDPLDNMLASTGFAVVRSNCPSVSNELLYLCLTESSFVEKMQQLAEQSTSTFPSIKPSDLGCCEIPCSISTDLVELLKAVFVRISINQNENRALAELRDTLLPKLVSSEIDFHPADKNDRRSTMETDIIQTEIEKAKKARCFLAELALALTIPSVCSRYGLDDEALKTKKESERYPDWYDQYVYPKFKFLTGKECYAVRCAILHNGDVDLYSQSIMRRENRDKKYRLMIPEYGDNFCLQYEENSQLQDRPFCAAALAMKILEGYDEFKEENPEFQYPLDRYASEYQ